MTFQMYLSCNICNTFCQNLKNTITDIYFYKKGKSTIIALFKDNCFWLISSGHHTYKRHSSSFCPCQGRQGPEVTLPDVWPPAPEAVHPVAAQCRLFKLWETQQQCTSGALSVVCLQYCASGVLSVSKQWRSLVDVNHLVPVKGYDYDCIIIIITIMIITDFFQFFSEAIMS